MDRPKPEEIARIESREFAEPIPFEKALTDFWDIHHDFFTLMDDVKVALLNGTFDATTIRKANDAKLGVIRAFDMLIREITSVDDTYPMHDKESLLKAIAAVVIMEHSIRHQYTTGTGAVNYTHEGNNFDRIEVDALAEQYRIYFDEQTMDIVRLHSYVVRQLDEDIQFHYEQIVGQAHLNRIHFSTQIDDIDDQIEDEPEEEDNNTP